MPGAPTSPPTMAQAGRLRFRDRFRPLPLPEDIREPDTVDAAPDEDIEEVAVCGFR